MRNLPKIVEEGKIMAAFGGGFATRDDLEKVNAVASGLVCADGAGMQALRFGLRPDLVAGDFDSGDQGVLEADGIATYRDTDPDCTDFAKVLRLISARLVVGAGFLGRRLDHQLAVLGHLAAQPAGRVLLLGPHEVVFRLPAQISLPFGEATGVSLFPVTPVTACSTGLQWNLDGIDLRPDGMIATSNRALGDVLITVEHGALLAILPRRWFDMCVAVLGRHLGVGDPTASLTT